MAMHDPLAVVACIDSSLVTTEEFFLDVETEGELTAGQTVGYRHPPIRASAPLETSDQSEIRAATVTPNAKVAVDVDAERFFELFLSRLTGP